MQTPIQPITPGGRRTLCLWLLTPLLLLGHALSAFAVPSEFIQDSVGNPLAGLPYTGGATYIYAPNIPPTDIALGNFSVNQTAGTNAVVGVLSTTDVDSGETYTYSLVAGTGDTNNASFNISGSTLRANNASSLAGGDYSVRIQTDDNRGGTFAKAFTVTVIAAPALPAGNLVISEFRLRGPSGANDEYVEIYNPTTNAITVQAADGTPGFAVVESSGTAVFVIPNGTVIPPHGHFLAVNSTGYGLNDYPAGSGTTATGDIIWTSDIPDNSGLALFRSSATFDTDTRLDAVGFTTSPALYREGPGLATFVPFSIEAALHRFHLNGNTTAQTDDPVMTFADGEPRDTDDNVKDFTWVDSNGTFNGGRQCLGAPGPKNLSSPIASYTGTSNMVRVLIDPSAGLSGAPNRVYDPTSAPVTSTFGTMEFCRTFTNETGSSLNHLRFRIVKLTTFPASPNIADLRPISSTTGPVITSNGIVIVEGTTLEEPPTQFNGGGWNSTFSIDSITAGTPLAAGASINLRVRFGIEQVGIYRFALLAEALPSASHLWILSGNTTNASVESEAEIFPNVAPTDIALAPASVNQSGGTNAVVGALATTDADLEDTHTYSLVSGAGDTNNNLFNISGSELRANNATALPVGNYSVRVQTADSFEVTFAKSFIVTVVNDIAPVANADSFTTAEDVELAIAAPGLLENDTDAANTNLTAVIVTLPAHGTLALNPDGSFTYLPGTNYFGSDSFTYQANDGDSNSEPVTVGLTINSINDLPVVAVNTGLKLLPTSTKQISALQLTTTDIESSAASLTYTLTTAPAHGSLNRHGTNLISGGTFLQSEINAGLLTYSSFGDAATVDGFTFSVSDSDNGNVPTTSFVVALNRIEREGEHVAGNYSISADGRYVAFQSTASNLVLNDTNGVADIFVLDRYTGVTTLVSASSLGVPGNAASDWPRISADGRMVTFQSSAGNLVANDSNNKVDVFVHDRFTAQTVRVSVSPVGAQANVDSLNPAISADGRYVAFHSFANNLVAGDVASQMDVFVHNLETHVTERVSLASSGAEGDNASSFASLSGDGRYVAFQSNARNLVTGDTNNSADVFVHDRQAHITTRVSVSSQGAQGNNSSVFPSISDDGRYVTFQANASNLIPDDTNNTTDVLLHDCTLARTRRLSVSSNGLASNGASSDPKISNDGRYIVFTSLGNNLVAGDTNGASDIFVFDRSSSRTTRVNLALGGAQTDANSTKPAISAGGRLIAFLSRATNLLPNANGLDQIYMVFFNDQPTITDIADVTIDEDGTTGPLAFTLSDAKSSQEQLLVSATSSNGDLVPPSGIEFTGSVGALNVQITPAANAFGTATITVVVSDGSLSSSNSFLLTVNAVNDAPYTQDDSSMTAEDSLLTVSAPGVLATAGDVENSPLTAVLVTGPTNGALTLNADGSFDYRPATNWHGADSFVYMANDGSANSESATVTIEVSAVNDIAVAAAQSVGANEDDSTTITLTANDVDDDDLSFSVASGPAHGTLSGSAPNLIYAPDGNFHGNDSFTFVANDGTADSAAATVSITVNAVNDVSSADAQSVTLNEDVTEAMTLAGGDVDGDALNFSISSQPEHGTLSGSLPNVVYTPVTNYYGSDSFTFVVNDSAPATVSLTINAVNDAPIAATQSVTLNEDGTEAITLTASDVDGDTLNFSIVNQPAHGTLSGALTNINYAPATNYSGSDIFTFIVNDGSADSAPAVVSLSITAVNDAPLTQDNSYETDEEQTLSVSAPGVLANANDVENSPLTAQLVSGPTHGTLILNPNGGFSYEPTFDFFGSDSFVYRANDGVLDSTPTTVTLTVNNIPDAPIATNDVYTLNEDTVLVVEASGVLTNDFDADADVLNAVLVVGPSHGTLELYEDGSFDYTPTANWFGTDGFTYLANDGLSDSEPVDVVLMVNSVNDIPVALTKNYGTSEDLALIVSAGNGLLVGATDVEAGALNAVLVNGAAYGAVTLNANGSFVYVPATNYYGPDGFTYRVSDGGDSSSETAVTLAISSVNDAPVVAAAISAQNGIFGSAFEFSFDAGTFADVDGDSLSYSASSLPTGLSFNPATRTFSGTPTQAGNYTVQVVANDNLTSGLTVNTEFAFTVAKAPLTITADNKARAYGVANPELSVSYSGFVAEDGVSALNASPNVATAVTITNGVGEYPITLAGGSDDNYEFTLVPGVLTIGKATVVATALDQSRTYGGANPELTIGYSGFVNDEDTNVLNVLPIATTEATTNSGAGSYPITLTGGSDDNYEITLVSGALAVGKVTIIATAQNQTRNYGAANPELTISYTGFVGSEDASTLDTLPAIGTTAEATSPVGDYPVTLAGGADGNYDITLENGTLTIGKATVVATADDQARAYGAANPLLEISYLGFVNGESHLVFDESPSASTTAIGSSGIGSYPITVAGGSASNYVFTLVAGTLTIESAELTITATDTTRTYGQSNAVFTGTISGLVNGEEVDATYATTATQSSPAGTYPIVPTLVDESNVTSNYMVMLVNGTLTITANDPPVVMLTELPGFYTIGTDAVLVDTNASVTDGGSLDFAGGTLTVTIVSNVTASDVVSLVPEGNGAGQIGLQGATVKIGGTGFATHTGGVGTNALVFSLNTNATPAIVQSLLRRLTFFTTNTDTAARLIEVVVADGDGGVSVPAMRLIELNRAPVANDETLKVSEGVNATIPFSYVLANDTDADDDTITIGAYSGVTSEGGRVTLNATNFSYRAAAGFTGVDYLAYLIVDGRGGESVGVLIINVMEKARLVMDASSFTVGDTNATMKLTMGGVPGQTYLIQVSDDLVDWSLLTTVTASPAGIIEVLDPGAAQQSKRFYRAMTP